jgi:hypothetical protein
MGRRWTQWVMLRCWVILGKKMFVSFHFFGEQWKDVKKLSNVNDVGIFLGDKET